MLGEICYGAGVISCVAAGICGIAELREQRKKSFVQIMLIALFFSIAYALCVAGWVRYLMYVDPDNHVNMLNSLVFELRTVPVVVSVVLMAGKMVLKRIEKLLK